MNTIKQEVMDAYSDSGNGSKAERNLNFRASEPVGKDEAVEIMSAALAVEKNEEGYNLFKPSALAKLPEGSEVYLAREGSVCAYVRVPDGVTIDEDAVSRSMEADELDYNPATKEYRLWWD
jgi:hypothetical protein